MASIPRASDHHYEVLPEQHSTAHTSMTVSDEERQALCNYDDKEFMKSDPLSRMSRLRHLTDIAKSYRGIIEVILVALVVLLLLDKSWVSGTRYTYKYEGTGDMTGFAPRCKSDRIRSGSFGE